MNVDPIIPYMAGIRICIAESQTTTDRLLSESFKIWFSLRNRKRSTTINVTRWKKNVMRKTLKSLWLHASTHRSKTKELTIWWLSSFDNNFGIFSRNWLAIEIRVQISLYLKSIPSKYLNSRLHRMGWIPMKESVYACRFLCL